MTANDLNALVAGLTARVDHLTQGISQLSAKHEVILQALNDQRRELENEIAVMKQALNDQHRNFATELAVLKRDVDELKLRRDVWDGRLFTTAMTLLGVVAGALLNHYLRKP